MKRIRDRVDKMGGNRVVTRTVAMTDMIGGRLEKIGGQIMGETNETNLLDETRPLEELEEGLAMAEMEETEAAEEETDVEETMIIGTKTLMNMFPCMSALLQEVETEEETAEAKEIVEVHHLLVQEPHQEQRVSELPIIQTNMEKSL